jgi:hypothetical protein
MSRIPKPALVLGLLGVLPFAATALAPAFGLPEAWGVGWDALLSIYALMILAFMSGCIWAFAARAEDPVGYGLSTLPALYGAALLMLALPFGIVTQNEALVLMALGFVLLLLLDLRASRGGQTPSWWLRLRSLLTALVVVSLLIGALT